jgi:hypothetical protein
MKVIDWRLVEAAARPLDREEREAVLGDLAEAGVSTARGLYDVLGLVLRREAGLWRNWRPWLAAFGLSLPSSLILMGFSLSVSLAFGRLIDPKSPGAAGLTIASALPHLVCQVLLLAGWSWTGGFLVGSLSRRTLYVSMAACLIPCLFCLSRFRVESQSRFSLLLFLVPAIWGVRHGLRATRLSVASALALALAVTVLIIPRWSGQGWGNPHAWVLDGIMSLPAWCLVAVARRHEKGAAST